MGLQNYTTRYTQSLYTEFTHTPDLHLKLGTTNTHSLHQIHITREIHQFYTFLKSDFEKYTGDTRCILGNGIFGVYSTYTLYTKITRVIPEYVSAGYFIQSASKPCHAETGLCGFPLG